MIYIEYMYMSQSAKTTHSVNFNGVNFDFDLVVSNHFLSLVFTHNLEDVFIYEEGFSDASSNASAILDVPLENFSDFFIATSGPDFFLVVAGKTKIA